MYLSAQSIAELNVLADIWKYLKDECFPPKKNFSFYVLFSSSELCLWVTKFNFILSQQLFFYDGPEGFECTAI